MRKIIAQDILDLVSYEKERQDYRQRIIDIKKRRRTPIGDKVSLIFENRDTVLFQIQEMLRAERIVDSKKIQDEINVYNDLVPNANELSATLFLEIEDQNHTREQLLKFLGIDEVVYLKLGSQHSIHARFEPGHSKEDKISAVQYVRFPFNQEEKKAFIEGGEEPVLVVDHPNYRAQAVIGPEMRKSLAGDLAA